MTLARGFNEPRLIREMREGQAFVADIRAAVPGATDVWLETVKARAVKDAKRSREIVRLMMPEIVRMQQRDAQDELRTLTARAKQIVPAKAAGEPCS